MLAEKIFIGGEFVNELNKLQREGIQAPLELPGLFTFTLVVGFHVLYLIFHF
jgi:hypothetical protein